MRAALVLVAVSAVLRRVLKITARVGGWSAMMCGGNDYCVMWMEWKCWL